MPTQVPNLDDFGSRTLHKRVYAKDYFTGVQAGIYIGDVYIDEVTSIQYSLMQSKVPIYGYASQLFDAVVPGVVIVEGNLSINFKESGYLWIVLSRYKKLQEAIDSAVGKAIKAGGSGLDLVKNRKIPGSDIVGSPYNLAMNSKTGDTQAGVNIPFVRTNKYDAISRAGIEQIVSGRATRAERFKFYENISGQISREGVGSRNIFESLASTFEEAVWQEQAITGQDISLDIQARRADSNIFDDIDIFITYGDWTNPSADKTVRRLRGVRFTGFTQAFDYSGNPIQESYSFMARNIV
jgi:hypothetical protein